MTERGYQNYIESLLVDEYGEDRIERQVYLSETYRYVDFLIDIGFGLKLAVEVEHSSEKAIKEGLAQAQLYAQHNRRWTPVVIYPPDGENEPELEMISPFVTLVPIPHRHQ